MNRIRLLAPVFLTMVVAVPLAFADDDDQFHREEKERHERIIRKLWEGTPPPPHRYAAIAYSRSTGNYAWANGWGELADAQTVARRGCRGPDTDVVAWVADGYVALAVGRDNVYGAGYGTTAEQAEAMALRECRKRTSDAHLVKTVSSALGPPSVPPETMRPGRILRR